jgi:hypothetical protein
MAGESQRVSGDPGRLPRGSTTLPSAIARLSPCNDAKGFGEPDFTRLPEATEAEFERRVARLPLDRVHSRMDADTVIHDEMAFLDAFCTDHGVAGDMGLP